MPCIKPRARIVFVGWILSLVVPVSLAQQLPDEASVPAGAPKSAKTKNLEAGAKALRTATPLKPFNVYLVGFHPMEDNPEIQMEAHHYCHQVNEDFAQCVLFDGNERDAHMHGLE